MDKVKVTASDVIAWAGPRATAAFLHGRQSAATRAASIGTLAHSLILGDEPRILTKRTSWSTKEGKEEQRAFLLTAGLTEPEKLVAAETEAACARAGWDIVSEADVATARVIAARYVERWGDPAFEVGDTGLVPAPGPEVDVQWQTDDAILTGRVDLLTDDGAICDIKVWHDSDFAAVRRRAMTSRTALQLAHYYHVLSSCGWPASELSCALRVISSTQPYMTYELILHPADLDLALIAWRTVVDEIIDWHRAGCPITYDGGYGLLPSREV